MIRVYHIAGNFRGDQFSRMASLQSFRRSIFTDARDHDLYNRAYFTGLFRRQYSLSTKTTKIGPLEYFTLYGVYFSEKDVSCRGVA
jgi:hypothetical protein